MFGQDFLPALVIIPFSALTLVLNYINTFLSILINLQGKAKIFAITTFISLLINAGLNLTFIPYFFSLYGTGGSGIGASLTTNISELFIFVSFVFVIGIRNFGYKNLLRASTIIVIFLGIHFLYAQIQELGLLYRIICATIAVLCLPFVTFCFNVHDIKLLKEQLVNLRK